MIVIKRNCSSSKKDDLYKQSYTFGDYTIRFTENEYRAFTNLRLDWKVEPEILLESIIEEGLYALWSAE